MTSRTVNDAPGWPGIPPRWTSSAKSGVGTALSSTGRVWFTLSHGILDEIYYPRVDQACTRDLGLIVTDGQAFFSEEKRHAESRLAYLTDGVPAYRLVNTCVDGRYRIEKEILADPQREAYRAYGIPRGTVNQIAGPKVWARGLSATLSAGVGAPGADLGELLVERAEIVVLIASHHV